MNTTNTSPHDDTDGWDHAIDRALRRSHGLLPYGATRPDSVAAVTRVFAELGWPVPESDGPPHTPKPGWGRWILAALVVGLIGGAVVVWHRPAEQPPPDPEPVTPAAAEPVPPLPVAPPPRLVVPPDYDDPRYLAALTGTHPPFRSGNRDTLFSKASYDLKQTFPADDFKHAWVVKYGPNQALLVGKMDLVDGRFVIDREFRTNAEEGVVLLVVVLSPHPAPSAVLDQPPNSWVPARESDLEQLPRYYGNPAANATGIREMIDHMRGDWKLPPGARVVARPYWQSLRQPPPAPDTPPN